MTKLATLFVCVATWTFTAGAQTSCEIDDSEATCQEKVETAVNAALLKGAAAEAKAHTADGLEESNTGVAPSAGADSAATFADFFTTLKAAADQTSADGETEALGFEFSRCLRERIEESPLQCQVRIRLGGAELYEPLRQALPEARADEIEGSIERNDSITAGIFLNLIGQNWGRVPRFGDEPLFDAIWTSVAAGTASSTEAANAATTAYEDVVDEIVEAMPMFTSTTTFEDVADATSDDLAQRALALREAAYRAEYQSMDDLRQKLAAANYFDLVDLVNNQPQLNFGVEYTQRDELAGPEEWRAKLVWEKGFVNVNTARAAVYATPGADDADVAVQRLQEYLAEPAVARRLSNGDRLALSIEIVERKAYAIDLVTDLVSLRNDSESSVVAAFSYGYYVDFDDTGKPRSRLDIKAAYEDVSTDASRQDRGTVSATFSQLVLGKTLLAVSLVYGTKPEFRGSVDEELSARLGFNYKWGKSGAL